MLHPYPRLSPYGADKRPHRLDLYPASIIPVGAISCAAADRMRGGKPASFPAQPVFSKTRVSLKGTPITERQYVRPTQQVSELVFEKVRAKVPEYVPA